MAKGERLVPAADYFALPRQNVRVENVLAPDELLTHVILPAPGNVKSGHYEVRYKASHDWPIAFATVLISFHGATVQSARVVMGAVAPIPWRSPEAEQAYQQAKDRESADVDAKKEEKKAEAARVEATKAEKKADEAKAREAKRVV